METVKLECVDISTIKLEDTDNPILHDVQLARQANFGDFEITSQTLDDLLKNFDNDTYGQRIAFDLAHNPDAGAAGFLTSLKRDGHRLLGDVELTPFGVDAIKNKGFGYISPEYALDYKNKETGDTFGPTLIGAALTTRPALKNQKHIKLEESQEMDTKTEETIQETTTTDFSDLVASEVARQLEEFKSRENSNQLRLKQFEKELTDLNVSEEVIQANIKLADGQDETTIGILLEAIKLQQAFDEKKQAEKKLGAMGYEKRSGVVTSNEKSSILKLQERIDNYITPSEPVTENNRKFAENVLRRFDKQHEADYQREVRKLSGESGGDMGDIEISPIWTRTVLRESLHNMVGLNFVNTGTVPFSNSWVVPYSYRDTTAAGVNSARIYQNQPIAYANVIQTTETAYPMPQKLALAVTDELRHLSTDANLDWNIIAEQTRNAQRIIAEDTDRAIFNELVQSADEVSVIEVEDEDISSQLDGTNTIFVTEFFPIVKPRKIFDLNGSQIGTTTNPLTFTLNGDVINEYVSGITLEAGTYYVLNNNLGEFSFCDEDGVVFAATGTCVVTYSYSTNVVLWDSDLGSLALDEKYDQLLYEIGRTRTTLETRLTMPNYALCSRSIMDAVEQARQFAANYARPGTDLQQDGNLGRVKNIPFSSTYAPNLLLGNERILISERYTTRFRMMKPWSMGVLQDKTDANGYFIGQKHAYGEQFIGLHTPTQLKRNAKSIIVYSDTNRVARED